MTDEEKATEIKIAILLDKIKLQSQRLNELTKENAEQKAQIEKMKCCGNCSEPCWNPPIVRKFECINNNHSLWRLRI